MLVKRYYLLNKPYGYLSQFSPEPGSRHETLAALFPFPNVYPVGRLDWDSEGLLLLTNDGEMQHRMTDPKFAHPRTYWAQVEGSVSEEALGKLRSGVKVQDYVTRPARVRLLREEEVAGMPERATPIRYRAAIPTAWIELELTEGRNRQVRRMTAAVGLPTLRLVRVKIGEIGMDGLAPGQWREIMAPKMPPRPGSGLKGKGRPR